MSGGPQLVHLELDEKDKESLQELQQSMGQAQQELSMLRSKVAMREAEKRRSDLTLHELSDLPDGTKAYKQVGKMFLLKPMSDIKKNLTETCESVSKDVTSLNDKKKHVEDTYTKVQADFQEFVKAHMVSAEGGESGESSSKDK